MESGKETQNNSERGHETEQRNTSDEKAPNVGPRQSAVEGNSADAKKDGYFSKFGNWVNLLTLLFVAAYTVITFVQWRSNHIFNKKQLRSINAQLSEMRSSSAQTDQTIAIFRDQAATMRNQLEEMRVENRPRIDVDAAIGNVTWDGDGLHFPIQYTIKIFGRASALHVTLRDELGNNLVENQTDNTIHRLKTISDELRSGKPFGGYPIPPGSHLVSVSNLIFSRNKIDTMIKFSNTLKRDKKDASPPIRDIKSVPITVSFVVGYFG
jgi:hypothetical protein